MSLFNPYTITEDVVKPGTGAQPAPSDSAAASPLSDLHTHEDHSKIHARWSRCPHCLISVSTIETPPPSKCPYCRKPLIQTEEYRDIADAVAPPSKEEVASRLDAIYHKPAMIVCAILAAIAFFILGWAIFEQLNSVGDFWYKGVLIASYSLLAGLFVISRFIFAGFYQAPRDVGYEPTITVLVPCFNEGEAIRQTIERIFAAGYPIEKLEVICVNDGSKDDSLAHMLAAQTRHPHLVVVNFEKNRGLCHGWGVATFLARGEMMVCVDSDTFVFPGSLHKLMQGFIDPSVGGISGHCDIENADVNLLTRLQDVRYYFSYKIMKAAESVFGCVSCLPGCFSAYRRVCVLAVINDWINATVMGESGNFADDRSLTNLILKDYKVIYDDQALATTICPETWKQYARQQARWERSYLREIWKTSKFIWRKHPIPAISWYAMMWMPIIEPVIIIQALVFLPIASLQNTLFIEPEAPFWWHISEALVTPQTFFLGVMAITTIWSLHFFITTGRKFWWAGYAFTLSYIFFFSWQIYWALYTIKGKAWGTRS